MFARAWPLLVSAGLVACSESGASPDDSGAGGSGGHGGMMQQSGAAGAPGGAGGSAGSSTAAGAGQGGSSSAGAAGSAGSAGAAGMPASPPICPDGPFADSPLPSQNLTAQSRCSGFRFTEGPVWIASRELLLFSDFEHGRPDLNFTGDIVSYVPGADCQTFIPDTGTNGLASVGENAIWGASHLTQTITEFDLDTKDSEVVVPDFMGMSFSSPNDLALHDNGTLYFTDPGYEVGSRAVELPQSAYYREPDGTLHRIEELNRPNGISLSPDQTKLYIAVPGKIRRYQVSASGVPSAGEDFIDEGSDGMVVDCAGNLYLTSGGVQVYDAAGEKLGSISAPGTTNVAFGGPERKTLFITGGTALYAVDLAIPGYPY